VVRRQQFAADTAPRCRWRIAPGITGGYAIIQSGLATT
jgi:hypothetical protein